MRALRGHLAAGVTVLLVGAAVWYLVAPPKGSDGYRERMAEATRTLRSQVQSARIWARTFTDGHAMRAAATVGFREAERDATAAASEFESYEPAPRALALRSRFVSLAARSTGALADLRIAAQLERWDSIAPMAARLAGVAARLSRFERTVRP